MKIISKAKWNVNNKFLYNIDKRCFIKRLNRTSNLKRKFIERTF